MQISAGWRTRTEGTCRSRHFARLIRAAVLGIGIVLGSVRIAPAQEVQIPFDADGTLQVLQADDAERLGLFIDEYPGLQEARLFRTGNTVSLELLVRGNNGLSRVTRTLTLIELEELRGQVARALASPRGVASSNARSLLLASSTLLGLTVYGPSIPIALDVDDTKSATALYMAVASASFFVPWVLTSNVTPAMAQAGYYGSTRGFIHGSALHYLVTGEEDAACDLDDCDYLRQTLASGVAAGVAEGVLGYRWARASGMSGGTANAISLGGDLGMLNGFALGALTRNDGDDTEDDDDRLVVGLGLTGAASGLMLGRLVAADRAYSYGDVEVLSTGSGLGAFIGYVVADQLSDGTKPRTAAAMVGSLAGVAAADRLVSDAEFGYGQSTLVRLGTLAGGLLGYGAGVLLESESNDLTGMSSAAGAAIGFAATYRTVERSARTFGRSANLQIHFTPHGFASLLASDLIPRTGMATPVASVTYRF